MKLKLTKRIDKKKSALTQMRFNGDIPAAIYRLGQPSEKVTVSGIEFSAVLRALPKSYLPTTIFELDLEGDTCRAIVKGIQYHRTTYRIDHLDFQVLEGQTPVAIKVPVLFVGEADCVGVKLGGFIRRVMWHIRVRALPTDIPKEFKLDIQKLQIGEFKRVGDIDLGPGRSSLIPEKEVVVVIAKR